MSSRAPYPGLGGRTPGGGLLGTAAPLPRDLLAVLATLFVTFSLQFFDTTAIVPLLLRLTPAVTRGFVWQLVTYPFVGWGRSGLWFLVELLILYFFARDVFWRLGQRRFWRLVVLASGGGALVAVVTAVVAAVVAGGWSPAVFVIMQGQRMLLAITIAAFATLYGEATVLLFFVVPVKARWFLWLEVLFAFLAFLEAKDGAGLLGLWAAILITYLRLTPGGTRQATSRWRRQIERLLVEWRLARLRRRRRLHVVDGEGGDRWVH